MTVKFKAPNAKQPVKRTSIRIPKAMVVKIDEDMQRNGFNKKQRSQWFSEVISDLLAKQECTHLIAEEFIVPGTTQPVAITIEQSLLEKIDQVISRTRELESEDCDRSSVIRTAILQRLLIASGMQFNLSGGNNG